MPTVPVLTVADIPIGGDRVWYRVSLGISIQLAMQARATEWRYGLFVATYITTVALQTLVT